MGYNNYNNKWIHFTRIKNDISTLSYAPAHLGVGELQVPSSLHVAEGDPSSRYPLTQ